MVANDPDVTLSVRTREALHCLIPPHDYMEPADQTPRLGAFGLLLDENTPEVIGRILGSGTAASNARWHHLAGDAAACEAVKASVMVHHVSTLPEWRAIASPVERHVLADRLGGRFCRSSGRDALLVHGTRGWDECVQLARHLAQRENEPDEAYALRCRKHHAWAARSAFEKAGVALLILRQAAALLGGGGADLFEGMPSYSLACLSADALAAHLRVPPRLRFDGCAVERLLHPYWRWRPPKVSAGGGGGGGGGGCGGEQGAAPPAVSAARTAATAAEVAEAVDVSAEARSLPPEADSSEQRSGGGASAAPTPSHSGARCCWRPRCCAHHRTRSPSRRSPP